MLYDTLVFIHVLLLVFWLGGDLGVFIIGQQTRRVEAYTLNERMALMKTLVMVDMGPRTCAALMVPVSLSVAHLGGWWQVPGWLWALSFLVGAVLLYTAWTVFFSHGSPKAQTAKRIEFWLLVVLAVGYLSLGVVSLTTGGPLVPDWLAAKTILYGLIFVFAIMIDVAFKPVGPALTDLIENGSTPEREAAVLKTMNRTRKWVLSLYAMLFLIGYLGVSKPF